MKRSEGRKIGVVCGVAKSFASLLAFLVNNCTVGFMGCVCERERGGGRERVNL